MNLLARYSRCALCAAALWLPIVVITLAAGESRAQRSILIAPGPEAEDTSYYSFIPLLIRGDYATLYAHTAEDENGFAHDMESFVRFDLPPDLLLPGETVLWAELLMVFSFSFDHGGNPPLPGGELSVSEILEDWSESTLNFANHPASGPAFETLTGIDAFGTLYLDVTEPVRRWARGTSPNYGFKLSNPTDLPIGFHSFEANVDPALKAQLLIFVPEPSRAALLAAGLGSLPLLQQLRRRRRRAAPDSRA